MTDSAVRGEGAALSISEDRDEETAEQTTQDGVDEDPDYDAKEATSVAKWGMAGLLLVYAGLGTYCVATTLGGATGTPLARSAGSARPEGVSRSVAAALAQPTVPGGSSSTESVAAAGAGTTRGVMSVARPRASKPAGQTTTPEPAVEALTAVSAIAIGPDGAIDGDHPDLAPSVIDPRSGMSWVTHWYETAHFGDLQQGTGLLLDMGKPVTIRQVELALGGSPGFWGADLQIRIGDTPDLGDAASVAMATDVGGRLSQDLGHAVTGRYVEIWFTKLPLDSWGTYQEHVYGVAVRGYVPGAHRPASSSASTTSHTVHPGRQGNGPVSRGHGAAPHRWGVNGDTGYGAAGHEGGGHHGPGDMSRGGHQGPGDASRGPGDVGRGPGDASRGPGGDGGRGGDGGHQGPDGGSGGPGGPHGGHGR